MRFDDECGVAEAVSLDVTGQLSSPFVEQTGVQGVRRLLGYSKRDLLLFSRLHIMGLDRQLRRGVPDSALAADCEFLAEAGFLAAAPEGLKEIGLEALSRLQVSYPEVESEDWPNLDSEKSTVVRQLSRMGSAAIHPSSLQLRQLPVGGEMVFALIMSQTGERSIPILDTIPAARDWQRLRKVLYLPTAILAPSFDAALVSLVLSNLPIPGDDVPLEAILDFATDDQTRSKLAGLDIWMRKAARSGKELQDVALEMEESLHDFREHMRLADMRSQISGFRVAMSVPLGVIEQLLHLKPKGALDVVFEYRDRKANRLEAELAAPGGALAYVYEAEKRFGR